MGYSLRTKLYRYTEWLEWDATAEKGQWDLPAVAIELYNHIDDGVAGGSFDEWERTNVYKEFPDVVEEMGVLLRRAFNVDVKKNTSRHPPPKMEI